MSETVASILAAHRAGETTPADTVARSFERLRAHGDDAMFISVRDEAEAIAEAKALTGKIDLPLYGVPVAVKDNIDVAGLPTTAACPDFAYRPQADATVVAKLRAAGAIVIGKTNLDQLATGLVGVRSPYGIPRNTFDPSMIPGGSSSGSGVAVAAGIVPISLGTDTAGSGRVPAGLNNIVGLKPSVGLLSTFGVVPACRTLDCVSVFALTVDDAFAALDVMAGPDHKDAYSRSRPLAKLGAMAPGVKIGVPKPGQLVFFGDKASEAVYEAAVARFVALGAQIVEVDIEPFYETARLLYDGPWVAERYITAKSLIVSSPESLHPVTREITLSGARPTAVDAFMAFYKLEEVRRIADLTFKSVAALLLPTYPTHYTVEQLLANPIELNSRLGTYTNFVNLLDLCGLAVPAAMRPDGMPSGVTLMAPGGNDAMLASLGRVFHHDTGLTMGALGLPQPPLAPHAAPAEGEIAIAVVGAHLSGMPLNGELRTLGARLIGTATTAPDYKLYALAGTKPPKPGMLRVAEGKGTSIALEIWALPAAGFGSFVNAIPAPLSIGSIRLSDGNSVKGFLVEALAIDGARDISEFGGWRAFVTAVDKVPA